jgi:indole-3-glycerol phosphate synthase
MKTNGENRMGFLEPIIANKRNELLQAKDALTRSMVGYSLFKRSTISLTTALKDKNSSGIIAEFKRKSPSQGWFVKEDLAINNVARAYEQNGAAGISVLTDRDFFGGAITDLETARQLVSIPLLRKDFIIDQLQVKETKIAGADVILLIAACLSRQQVKEFSREAHAIGLEVLLEIHNEKELDHICPEIDLVGVNNRNLTSFEVNIETSFRLINQLPKEKCLVSESGIRDVETIISLKRAGFNGFLVGESFMKQADPAIAFAEFIHRLNAKAYED